MASLLEDLHIKRGITEKQIEQLVAYSNTDKQILEFTTDSKRFKNKNAFNIWLKKGRTIYTLTGKEDELLGVIWYGKKGMPDDKNFTQDFNKEDFRITFAIRLYGATRGKGLSLWFMKKARKGFIRSKMYRESCREGFWLETYVSNTPAVRTYRSFGYKEVSFPDSQNRIIMIL